MTAPLGSVLRALTHCQIRQMLRSRQYFRPRMKLNWQEQVYLRPQRHGRRWFQMQIFNHRNGSIKSSIKSYQDAYQTYSQNNTHMLKIERKWLTKTPRQKIPQ